VPWLRSLVAGLLPRRPGFAPGLVHVGFVMDEMAHKDPLSSSRMIYEYIRRTGGMILAGENRRT
jgi:hypothetical protein